MLAIVGCGFLGSLYAEEIAKRCFALEQNPRVLCVDFDTVETRNAANQLFTLEDAGAEKARAIAYRMRDEYHLHALPSCIKVDKTNIKDILGQATLIVDAVDHLPSRQLLWMYAKSQHIPCLHLGISQGGSGNVDWTYEDFDSWSLSPIATLGQPHIGTEKIEKLKPCELVAFRGLGLNVAIAAAKSTGLWWGLDPEGVTSDVLPRTLAVWRASNLGHELVTLDTRYT